MTIHCIWEHNGNDSLLYAVDPVVCSKKYYKSVPFLICVPVRQPYLLREKNKVSYANKLLQRSNLYEKSQSCSKTRHS